MSSFSASPSAQNRLVVLISGNGTNLQAIIDACSSGSLSSTKVIRVICNRRAAFGIQRAEKAGIPWTYHNIVKFRKDGVREDEAREAFDQELASLILAEKPHLVVCAGWMLVLSKLFVEKMAESSLPVINLHPSLPGPDAIKGARAIERAYEAFQHGELQKTGCMIHYVVEEVDAGECLVSKEVSIKAEDTLADLEARIHQEEWVLIVEGVRKALQNLGVA